MSTRRARPGGWVKRQRGLCRWCGSAVPKRRFTFCGDTCVHEWKLRTDPGYLRDQVFARDHGVCAECGIDTEALRRDKRKLDWQSRRQFEKEWGGRRHFWDADHIVPVAEGGGECDLSNMRTLCLKCHRAATASLRKRLAGRSKTSAGNGDAGATAEGTMAGKKAHKPKITKDAGMHGVQGKSAHARKSEAQTSGQYERDPKRRTGQFSGAGDPPMMKK